MAPTPKQWEQLQIALKCRTGIYIPFRNERYWRRLAKLGLATQLESGNWLPTDAGWELLRRRGLPYACFGDRVPRSSLCGAGVRAVFTTMATEEAHPESPCQFVTEPECRKARYGRGYIRRCFQMTTEEPSKLYPARRKWKRAPNKKRRTAG